MHEDKSKNKTANSLHNHVNVEYTLQQNISHDKESMAKKICGNGCQHYSRSCMLIAECCKRTYPCRLCHDDNEEHRMDRNETKDMLCLFCGTIQLVAKNCKKCNKSMSAYFCEICRFWSDKEDETFHCQKCGLCRIGKQDVNVYHCDQCNACLDIRLKDNHVHIENNLKSDCPICAEYMFTSVKEVVLLKCGHAMHMECFDFYLVRNYQCPICQKSAGDTRTYNKKIDKILQNSLKLNKKDYDGWLCEVNCYDCRKKTIKEYKFMFNKCELCDSYNTRLGDIHKPKKE